LDDIRSAFVAHIIHSPESKTVVVYDIIMNDPSTLSSEEIVNHVDKNNKVRFGEVFAGGGEGRVHCAVGHMEQGRGLHKLRTGCCQCYTTVSGYPCCSLPS